MDLISNQRGGLQSQSWHHCINFSTHPKSDQELLVQRAWGYHSYDYRYHQNVLKYCICPEMDVRSSTRWSKAITMISCHHFHSTMHQNCQHLTQLHHCKECKDGFLWLQILLKGAKSLHICPLRMWEAIKGCLQPQPCHHGIIFTWLLLLLPKDPEFPKSDPTLSV